MKNTMNKLNIDNLTVGVWDCTFYLTDDDGNEILNNDGTVKMFDVPNMDWSYVAEHIEFDDLKEIDNEK